MQSCWTTITSVLVSSGADNAVLSKCFATLEKKPKCAQGKTECTSFYLFVLLSPKMIWWHLRCSKEYMYIYRYIYTTIRYMYMYIYLYHVSCEPNHVIKPIFHLSVKISCYPVSHTTNDLKTRRLCRGIDRWQAQPLGWSLSWQTPQVNNVTPTGRIWWEWPCLQDRGGHQAPAVCTGGKEAGGQSTNSQKNVRKGTWSQICPMRGVFTRHGEGQGGSWGWAPRLIC